MFFQTSDLRGHPPRQTAPSAVLCIHLTRGCQGRQQQHGRIPLLLICRVVIATWQAEPARHGALCTSSSAHFSWWKSKRYSREACWPSYAVCDTASVLGTMSVCFCSRTMDMSDYTHSSSSVYGQHHNSHWPLRGQFPFCVPRATWPPWPT